MFADESLGAIADRALERETGARGLRSILEAALAQNLDAPDACRAGVCSTCKAKVTTGDCEMLINHALEDYEVEAGFVLTCQCYPLSDRLVVDYDQH